MAQKTELLRKGEPAIETPRGKVYATAKAGPEGRAVGVSQPRDRAPLRGGKPRVTQSQDNEQFKIELKTWLRGGGHLVTNQAELLYRYLQIYHSLREIMFDRAVVLLEGFEPGQHIKSCLNSIKYDPSLGISTIKYCTLYLASLYTEICEFLDHPQSGLKINRPDLLSAHTPEDIEAKKQERERVRKEQGNAQFQKDMKDDHNSGGL